MTQSRKEALEKLRDELAAHFYAVNPNDGLGDLRNTQFSIGFTACLELLWPVIDKAEDVRRIWMGTIECTHIFPMFDALQALDDRLRAEEDV